MYTFRPGPTVATEAPPKFTPLPDGTSGTEPVSSLNGMQHRVDLRFGIPAALLSGLDAAGIELVLAEHERQRAEHEASRPPPPTLPDHQRAPPSSKQADMHRIDQLLSQLSAELHRLVQVPEEPPRE
jgi:hypothetical protein